MASEIFSGTEAVGTTEHSMPADAAFGGGTIQTTDVDLQLYLDLSDMIAGDDLQLRIYEKVQSSDTQRIVYESRLNGPQSPPNQVFPAVGAFTLLHGWDATLDAIAGTITVTWSGRQVGPETPRLDRATKGNVLGTVGAASSTTSIVTSSLDPAAAVTDQFKGRIVTFTNNTTTANLRGQATDITASTSGGALTVTALSTAPVSGDLFVIT